MPKPSVVQVAVENTALSFDGLFDYAVPQELAALAVPGSRVLVPFGRANVTKIGMIFGPGGAPLQKLKPICAVLDAQPVLSGEQLALARYLARTTFCPLYEAVRVQLPAGIHLKLTECYQAESLSPEVVLSEEQQRIYRAVAAAEQPVSAKKLVERFGFVEEDVFRQMVEIGALRKTKRAAAAVGDKTVRTARLCTPAQESVRLTPKQQSVVDALQDVGQASVQEICYFTGVTPAVLNTLCKKGIIELFDAEVLRIEPVPEEERLDPCTIVLSGEQQAAYEQLGGMLAEKESETALLYGVTGSGKTSVFLKAVGDVVRAGRQAIVMVPEISLTAQTVQTFYRYFGTAVAVLHSGLSVGERYDQYKRIRAGEVRVVVGTRSAVFAPLSDIGIIVMDEEQESTYKSESSPRYHARQVARFRCKKHGALLLLASATPSLDSFYKARSGQYRLLKLSHRFGEVALPEVTIVDMSARTLAARDSAFSPTLLCELQKNLESGEQSILLYNRRGYHTMASCGDCKQVISCPNCSIALTYHKQNGRLMCHYCGYSHPLYETCPSCGSSRMFYRGQGTQRVEDELSVLFPDARVLRMDLDASAGRAAHQRQFGAFERGEYDILVGTQMVAKGLNFPGVTLVGVMNADQTLYANDFRAFERGFSLITQVVGRSGRFQKTGRAVIQTATPQNPVIALAAQQDYEGFYEQEISVRRAMLYPPFCDLCVVGFVSARRQAAQQGAERFVEAIVRQAAGDTALPLRVLGPSPMNVIKIGGKYRYRLIIKCRGDRHFYDFMHELLCAFQRDRENRDVTVFADINEVAAL